MFRFAPQSISATGPSPVGSAIVTSRTRSRPIMLGTARAFFTSDASSRSPVEIKPFIAPSTRSRPVSARVSSSSMPAMPASRR